MAPGFARRCTARPADVLHLRDRIVVKDGGGQFVDGKGRHNRGKGKHFSHTSNSRCHGEGPAHYQLKVALCASINRALTMRPDERNMQ